MEEEGNADYEGMVQPSLQHVTPCVKGVEWGLGTRGLRIVMSIEHVVASSFHERATYLNVVAGPIALLAI